MDDQIIIKSDGFPTYHLAVVVDDHLMEITHVLRGEEWLSSTPKQIILHQMFGWTMPVYAHVPLILNPDKTKLSKRQGDVSAQSYLDRGFLPEALINFFALLGWNPTADREIFSRAELIKLFDLRKVNKAGAVLNVEKLKWMNGQYLRAMPIDAYLACCRLRIADITSDASALDRACLLVRDRMQTLDELPDTVAFFFQPTLNYDATLLLWKTQTLDDAKDKLVAVREWLVVQDDAALREPHIMEERMRAWIGERGWQIGEVLWPLRVALSGARQSVGPFELLTAYGRVPALSRVDDAVAKL